jgi:type VI secretion system protein VasJ
MAAEDVILASQSKLGALLAPIQGGGEGGVGADVSYDEIFEGLKNEVDKLQSMSGDKPNWGHIVGTADEILSEKSKDYRVAVYWAAGRAHLDGLTGLLEGLVLMRDIAAAFWEAMYPALKRPKARGNLVAWYSDFLAPGVAAIKPTTKDADAAAAVDVVSRAVDADLRDKLGENYPGMGALRESIRNLLQMVPKEAPPPPPPTQATAAPAAQPSNVAAPPPQAFGGGGGGGLTAASIVNASTAASAVTQCSLLLARAGDALRAADPADAAAYRISRTGFWLEVDAAPPAEGGMTLVPPPPGGLRERFDAAVAAENWLEVLATADEVGSEYILWLDPHRYAANAMDRLGALFLNAKKALLREVAILLARAPKLPSLQFNDGTPLADGQTKMWLDAEVAVVFGGAGGGGGGGGGAAAGQMEGPIAEARGLAAGGKLDEAIALLGKAAASAPSPADRFRGRLAQAKLCLQAEQFAVARAQLEGLDRIAAAHRLTDWEPELCAEMYSALYAANRGINRGQEVLPEARAREEEAFAKLCELDAAAALKLASGS